MMIIKLGGSLSRSDALIDSLDAVERNYPDKAKVIVPGGGAFADQVRLAQQRWQFNDTTAHRMAILAMQQSALLINGIKPNFAVVDAVAEIKNVVNPDKVVIWSPDMGELDKAGIAPSWDITSDSLAAWLAAMLSADELILVKSADIDGGLNLAQLAEQQIVDKAFCNFAGQAACRIQIINVHSWCGSKPASVPRFGN